MGLRIEVMGARVAVLRTEGQDCGFSENAGRGRKMDCAAVGRR
jgi:hypothetical protein